MYLSKTVNINKDQPQRAGYKVLPLPIKTILRDALQCTWWVCSGTMHLSINYALRDAMGCAFQFGHSCFIGDSANVTALKKKERNTCSLYMSFVNLVFEQSDIHSVG